MYARQKSTPVRVAFANLTLVPMLGETNGEPDYLLLDAALEQGVVLIGEKAEPLSAAVGDLAECGQGLCSTLREISQSEQGGEAGE